MPQVKTVFMFVYLFWLTCQNKIILSGNWVMRFLIDVRSSYHKQWQSFSENGRNNISHGQNKTCCHFSWSCTVTTMFSKVSSTLEFMAELKKAVSICHLGTLKSLYTLQQLASSPSQTLQGFLLFPLAYPSTNQTHTNPLSSWPDVPCIILKYLMTPILSSFVSGCCLVASLYQEKILWNLLAVEIRQREWKTGYRGLILLVVITYIQKGSIYPLVLWCDFSPHCFLKRVYETSSQCLGRGIWFSVKFP